MTARGVVYVTAVVLLAAVAATAPRAASKTTQPHYYLALGDSLSTGFQPRASGAGGDTHAGYVNDIEADEKTAVKHLQLVDLGCPGDTTTSLLTGIGNTALASRFHCDRSLGSQLGDAVAFLKAHQSAGEVPLVTLDIGINDLNRCSKLVAPVGCLRSGERAIAKNTPRILHALVAAAAKRTVFVQMTIYDTYLGNDYPWSSSPLQAAFLQATREANLTIQTDDAAVGFRTADVAGAYDVYNTTSISWHDRRVPENLARACTLTWACSPSPIGHNIHPNSDGYQLMAQAFERVIRDL
jgi:lysophospholipase L1-like esterase